MRTTVRSRISTKAWRVRASRAKRGIYDRRRARVGDASDEKNLNDSTRFGSTDFGIWIESGVAPDIRLRTVSQERDDIFVFDARRKTPAVVWPCVNELVEARCVNGDIADVGSKYRFAIASVNPTHRIDIVRISMTKISNDTM